MESISLTYSFTLPNGSKKTFDLQIDRQTLSTKDVSNETPPPWTKIDFHQCPHCPLPKEQHPYCDVAVRLVPVVECFNDIASYEEISAAVITGEKTISLETTTQQALSSLMGLVVATSACPYTAFLKPMAYFHLPFASEEETIFRAASTYLLAQYFLSKSQGIPDIRLDGLMEIYKKLQVVNCAMGERLRAATKNDASVNALILLDTFAKAMPFVIDESLEEIRYLFEPFFSNQ